jgi:truncated hemoglobin YjbI
VQITPWVLRFVAFDHLRWGHVASLYELAGGRTAIGRLCERFYEKVFADDLLAPLFLEHGDHHAERLALWLTELLGGPAEHTEARGGFEVMAAAHHGLRISEAQRARWAKLMHEACAEVGLPDEFRRRFRAHVDGGSTFAQRVSWPRDQVWPR